MNPVAWEWPQFVLVGLILLELGMLLSLQGREHPPFSFWCGLANNGIIAALLYFGGFFA